MVSGAVAVSGASFRWTYWACFFFSCACWLATAFTIKETYAPIILARKAKRIRRQTGDDRYVAPIEMVKLNFAELLRATLLKPFIMLAKEPMLMALTIYTRYVLMPAPAPVLVFVSISVSGSVFVTDWLTNWRTDWSTVSRLHTTSFVYGVLYLLFEAVPLEFERPKPLGHGFNALIGGLMFIPLFLGGMIGVLAYVFIENPRYVRLLKASPNGKVAPEQRLVVGILGGATFFISFFWYVFTPRIRAACPAALFAPFSALVSMPLTSAPACAMTSDALPCLRLPGSASHRIHTSRSGAHSCRSGCSE